MAPKCYACKTASSSLQCSRCKEAQYCSRECQAAHWRLHKTVCQQIAEIKNLVPPSLPSSRTDTTASSLIPESSAEGAPSDDDLRVAWAIAAAADVARNGGGDIAPMTDTVAWGEYSGMKSGMTEKQIMLSKLCTSPTSTITTTTTTPGNEDGVENDSTPKKNSPLEQIASLLAGDGCSIDPPEPFGIPLQLASLHGNVEVVQSLLVAGADVNRATRKGHTALYHAITSVSSSSSSSSMGGVSCSVAGQVVRALAKAGASFGSSSGTSSRNPTGGSSSSSSPSASSSGPSITELLGPGGRTLVHLAAVQDTSVDGSLMSAVLDGWLSQNQSHNNAGAGGVVVDIPDDNGATPLLYAAVHGNIGAVKVLLYAGASPGKEDTSSQSSVAGVSSSSAASSSSSSASVSPSATAAACDAAFAAAEALMKIENSTSTKGEEAITASKALLASITSVLRVLFAAGGQLGKEPTIDALDVGLTVSPLDHDVALPTSNPTTTKQQQPALKLTPVSALCTNPHLAPILEALVDTTPDLKKKVQKSKRAVVLASSSTSSSASSNNKKGSQTSNNSASAADVEEEEDNDDGLIDVFWAANSDGSSAADVAAACGNLEVMKVLQDVGLLEAAEDDE